MYSVFEPSIVTSVFDILDSFPLFYINIGLTDLFVVESSSVLYVDSNSIVGSFITGISDGYSTVLGSQALLVE